MDRRATDRKKNKKLSLFLSKYWQHVRRAKLWLEDTYASIKAEHDRDVRARKKWQQQFEDKVWFPPRKDDRIIKEVERIFAEFEIYFEKRRSRFNSKQSLPVLGKSPSHR